MYIQPENPIVKQTLDNMLKKDLEINEIVHDYDGTVYMLQAQQDCVRVSLQTNCPDAIFAHGGDDMIQEVHPEFAMDKAETE